jgi:hypothetical protein
MRRLLGHYQDKVLEPVDINLIKGLFVKALPNIEGTKIARLSSKLDI